MIRSIELAARFESSVEKRKCPFTEKSSGIEQIRRTFRIEFEVMPRLYGVVKGWRSPSRRAAEALSVLRLQGVVITLLSYRSVTSPEIDIRGRPMIWRVPRGRKKPNSTTARRSRAQSTRPRVVELLFEDNWPP